MKLERPLPRRKNEKVIGLIRWNKWENNVRVCCIETKVYSYLIDDRDKNKKKTKSIKNIRRELKFEYLKTV